MEIQKQLPLGDTCTYKLKVKVQEPYPKILALVFSSSEELSQNLATVLLKLIP